MNMPINLETILYLYSHMPSPLTNKLNVGILGCDDFQSHISLVTESMQNDLLLVIRFLYEAYLHLAFIFFGLAICL